MSGMKLSEKGEWNYFEAKKTGLRHEKLSLECQDCMKYKKNGPLHVILLADAVSRNHICAAGVNKLLDVMCDFLLDEKVGIIDQNKDEIALRVYAEVLHQLMNLSAKYEVDREIFASTLLFVVFDAAKEIYLAFHLGDGVILIQDENDRYHIVSYPTNGFFRNETYLTTSEMAFRKIKIKKRKADGIKGFWLCTDGVYNWMELGAEMLGEVVSRVERNGGFETARPDDQGLITLRRK